MLLELATVVGVVVLLWLWVGVGVSLVLDACEEWHVRLLGYGSLGADVVEPVDVVVWR